MDNQEINNYVSHARQQGLSDEQIKLSLRNAGWPEDQINVAFTPQGSLAAPKYTGAGSYHETMWIAFQYILLFVTLATSAIALAGIAHHFIDETWGTPSMFSYFGSNMLLGYLASLIVAFPVFATLFVILRRKIEAEPEIRNIKSRKFFLYVALLWTFAVLLFRLVATIYGFLAGNENTAASLAHLLVTLLTSGSIFTYFVLDVRKKH